MNTYSQAVRVGIAGATGYAGQELVALLARHPNVRLTNAMSSSADSAARPLPRLNRVWDGQVEPLNKERLAKETDLTFLAVPESAAAELAPPLVDAGVRVIDLSGAFRIKSDEARNRWYPATKELPEGSAYGLTEFFKDDVKTARLVATPGCTKIAPAMDQDRAFGCGLDEGGLAEILKGRAISGGPSGFVQPRHFSQPYR